MDTHITESDAQPSSAARTTTVQWTGIVLYIVIAFALSWALWLGLGALGVPFTIRVTIGMFGPALSAVIVRLLRHEGFADAGLRLGVRGQRGTWRIYLAAYLLPPLLIAASIALVLLVGYQHWALNANMHALISASLKTIPAGFTVNQLILISLISQTVLAFTLGIPFNMIFTFGEEFGWRGYLLPRLAPLGGLPAAIITGVIWGLWHAPLIILNGYNYPGHPWLGVLMMVVFTTALSCVFAWLRFRSGSVWPSTLAHAAINAQGGFGALALTHADSLFSAPIGLLGLLPMIAFVVWLALTGRLSAQPKIVDASQK